MTSLFTFRDAVRYTVDLPGSHRLSSRPTDAVLKSDYDALIPVVEAAERLSGLSEEHPDWGVARNNLSAALSVLHARDERERWYRRGVHERRRGE